MWALTRRAAAKLNINRAAAERLLEQPREYYSFLFSCRSKLARFGWSLSLRRRELSGTMMLMGAWIFMGIVDFSLTLGLEWNRTLSGAPLQSIVQGQ